MDWALSAGAAGVKGRQFCARLVRWLIRGFPLAPAEPQAEPEHSQPAVVEDLLPPGLSHVALDVRDAVHEQERVDLGQDVTEVRLRAELDQKVRIESVAFVAGSSAGASQGSSSFTLWRTLPTPITELKRKRSPELMIRRLPPMWNESRLYSRFAIARSQCAFCRKRP